MNCIDRLSPLLAACVILLAINTAAFGQASVSIGAGFDCFTDIDGSKTLGKLESSGFRAVKFSAVNAKVEREIDALDAKAEALGEITNKPEHIHIVLQEIAEEDWGYSGQLTDDWRKSDKNKG